MSTCPAAGPSWKRRLSGIRVSTPMVRTMSGRRVCAPATCVPLAASSPWTVSTAKATSCTC
ncbi:MAG TPA: hypothetical protein ACQGQG_01530 [Xylella sp.]